jgi:large repetitive protein
MLLVNVATQSAPPQQLTGSLHINWSGMLAWAESTGKAVLPQGPTGSASGLSHSASTASTRAGQGHGSTPGKGAGAVSAYAPKAATVAKTTSGKAFVGFNAKTSKFDGSRSSADISVYDNADGSTTKHVSQSVVNFRTAKGVWQPIDTTLVRGSSGAFSDDANAFGVTFGGGLGPAPQSVDLVGEGVGASPAGAPTGTPTPGSTPTGSASPASTPTPAATPTASGTAAPTGTSASALATITLSPSESFAWSVQGAAKVAPKVSGDTATYPDILPHTTLQLSDQAWGVRELFELDSAQAGNTWTFPLSMTGVSFAKASEGR